ncbi:hypothetical protein ABMA32_05905 [Mesorhizobium sp. VNQ89]|uniref:hypothetical protein n=1 Tax=Mesorhizobium quangtriensis TaxID=3157709 RepID=UPI0032B83370
MIKQFSLRRSIDSFTALHAIQSILLMGYSLCQLLVLARVLDTSRFAEVILLTTISMFLLPLNVAAGRTNYVALREDIVHDRQVSNWHHVLQLLICHFLLILLVSFLLPIGLPISSENYLEDAIFLSSILSTNFVLNDVQVMLWAFDMNKRFVYVLLARSILQYMALSLLIISGTLFEFATISLLINLFTIIILMLILRKSTSLNFNFDKGPAFLLPASEHARRLFSSLISSFSEMTVLTLPYVLLTVSFGVGPALITYDVIMKFVRVVTAAGRVTTEVALPQITRDLLTGKPETAWRRYLSIIGLCVFASLLLAAALVIFDNRIFSLLLGPNNVVPEGTGIVAGVVVVIAAAYQPSHYIVSVNNSRRLIGCFAAVAVIGFVLFSLVFLLGPSLIKTIWAYACYFGLVTLALVTLSYLAIFARGLPGRG